MVGDETALAALKARVEAYSLDYDADAEPFSAKLRRETGWSGAYARRAVREYKRFAILAVAAGHKVSPPRAVDRVWHLHLTDTRRYWETFCPCVLGAPLHHEPSRGGAGEAEQLAQAYRLTLQSYVRLFGEAPPPDLWPQPSQCRPVRRALRKATPFAAVAAGSLLLVGCALVDSAAPGAIQGPEFIGPYAVLAAFGLLLTAALQSWTTSKTSPRSRTAELGVYDLAFLGGGTERVFATAMLRLVQAGHLVIAPGVKRGAKRSAAEKALSLGAPLPADAPPVERAIVDAVERGRLTGDVDIGRSVAEIKRRLQSAGLLPSLKVRRAVRRTGVVVMTPILLLGLVRLWFGLQNHRAVGFLVIVLALSIAVAIGVTASRIQVRTRAGERRLKAEQAAAPPAAAMQANDPGLAMALALWGLVAVGAGEFADFRHLVRAYFPEGAGDGGSSSSCGSGGGCGGGGCGG